MRGNESKGQSICPPECRAADQTDPGPNRVAGPASSSSRGRVLTEAINGRLEALRRNALGFRNLINYRIRSLLHCGALAL